MHTRYSVKDLSRFFIFKNVNSLHKLNKYNLTNCYIFMQTKDKMTFDIMQHYTAPYKSFIL